MKTDLPPPEWDKTVSALGGGIMQSSVWAAFQQSLGRSPVRDSGKGWAWLGAVRRSHGLNYLMCSYGPVSNSSSDLKPAIESVVAAGRKLGLDFVRLEPLSPTNAQSVARFGGRQIAEANPEHTRTIDLTQTEDQLRADLASGHRNLINGTERRGITIRRTEAPVDFEIFLNMLHETAKRAGVVFYADEYYRSLFKTLQASGNLSFYIAEAEGRPVAAALFYDWNGIRYYAHAGAFQDLNRKVKASVSLLWQAVLDAKAAGMKSFDLWGVAPEGDAGHPLATLSKFKQAFGGRQVDYGGTWDIPLKPAKYRLYQLYRRLRGRA